MDKIIEIKHLQKSFGDNEILKDHRLGGVNGSGVEEGACRQPFFLLVDVVVAPLLCHITAPSAPYGHV